MNVNILVDYQENGQDKNEPHIVCNVANEIMAGELIKLKLEKQGCKVQSLVVVDGIWTLEELHDMANYGKYLSDVNYRCIYISDEMMEYLESIQNNPEEAKKWQEELNQRLQKGRK